MEYLNKLLRKSSSSKKSEGGDTPKCSRTFNRDSEAEEDLSSIRNSTPKEHLDVDPESDTTAEYESAGEASPWGKEPNLSSLADCLAGVHISTPDKKIHAKLNHFPFSPIIAEDESDEEVTAIISSNKNAGLSLSLMEEDDGSQKSNSLNDGKNTPFVVISPSQVVANSTLETKSDRNEHNCSTSTKFDSFRVITELQPGTLSQSLSPDTKTNSNSQLKLEQNDNDKPSPISPSMEFQDAGPACSFHSEVMTNLEAQLLSGTLNSSLMSSNSLIIEECKHVDSSQTSCSFKVDENQITDKKYDDKSFINVTNHHKIVNLDIINGNQTSVSESESMTTVENTNNVKDMSAIISQENLSDSLKGAVTTEEQPVDFEEINLEGERNIESSPKKLGNINTTLSSGLDISSNKMSNVSIDNSENTSCNTSKVDLNKSVSLKDILFDKSHSNSVINLSIEEKPESNIDNIIIEEADIGTPQSNSETNISEMEFVNSGHSFSQNSAVVSENSLGLGVPREEISETSDVTLTVEKNTENTHDLSKSESSLLETRKDEKVFEKEHAEILSMSSKEKNVDICELVNKSHSADQEKLPRSSEVTDNSILNHTNECGNKSVEHSEIKCAFSQNLMNLSENVLKFANEKHPICLEEPSEVVDSLGSFSAPSEEIMLPSLQKITTPESFVSLTEIEVKESSCGNISISEMCNLIETTFNNSLKENLDEICENITSTNLKPISILLEKDEGEISDLNLATSPEERVIFPPVSSSDDMSTTLEVHSDEQMASEVVNTSVSDKNSDTLSKTIDDTQTINEFIASPKVASSKTLDASPSKSDQKVDSLSNYNHSHFSSDKISNEIANWTNTEIKKPSQMVNVEVIPCYPASGSEPKSVNPPSGCCTVRLKDTGFGIQKSEVAKHDICSPSKVKPLNNLIEPVVNDSYNTGADCIATTSSVLDATSCKFPNELVHSSDAFIKTEMQNALGPLNPFSHPIVPTEIPMNESKEEENSKKINQMPQTSSNELNQHNIDSTPNTNINLVTVEDSKNDSLSGIKETVLTHPNVSPQPTPVSLEPSKESSGNADYDGIPIEISSGVNTSKTEAQNGLVPYNSCNNLTDTPEITTSETKEVGSIDKIDKLSETSNHELTMNSRSPKKDLVTDVVSKNMSAASVSPQPTLLTNSNDNSNCGNPKAETQNAVEPHNSFEQIESKEIENIKTTAILSETLINELNQHTMNSQLSTKENLTSTEVSKIDLLSGTKDIFVPSVATNTNVSPKSTTSVMKSSDNTDCTGAHIERSVEAESLKNETCNSVAIPSNISELVIFSPVKEMQSNTQALINSESKISETSTLSTSAVKSEAEMITNNSSNNEVTHSAISDTEENKLSHVTGKTELSSCTIVDNQNISSESAIQIKPSHCDISAPSESKVPCLESVEIQSLTNAKDNTTRSLQNHLKSDEMSAMVDGIEKMKVDSQEQLFVSKIMSELSNSQKPSSISEVSTNSSSSNKEILVSKQLLSDGTNEIKLPFKDEVRQPSLSEDISQKSSTTSSSNKEIQKSQQLTNEGTSEMMIISQSKQKDDNQLECISEGITHKFSTISSSNKEVHISQQLTNEGTSGMMSISENNQANSEKVSISESFEQKTSFMTSATTGLIELGPKDVHSMIGPNTVESNVINSTSSCQQIIKGDVITENEKNLSHKRNDTLKSPLNKGINEAKQNVTHCAGKEHDWSKSTIERKSYDELLDKCLEQERLLEFDVSIKEEADKIVKELENFDSFTTLPEFKPCSLPSSNVNSSEAGPTTADEDIEKGDVFQDASNFDFEYLSKIRGKPGQRRNIRESLFLKFDPLASVPSPNPPPESEPPLDQNNKQLPDSSSDALVTPPRAAENREEQLVSITPIVVHSSSPAARQTPQTKLRRSTGSATPSLRHEFLSKEIYKLQELLLTQESSYQEQIAACMDEIDELKQKLAELEDREPQDELEEKVHQAYSEIETLKNELEKSETMKTEYLKIIAQYDETAVDVLKKNKELKAEVDLLKLEKEDGEVHLRNMELAFNDIHQKYEKCKEAIALFQRNEIEYKESLASNKKSIDQMQDNYQKLKEHASQKLEQASAEIVEMKKAHQADIARLEAINKKLEVQVKGLEESLEQKKIEVAELTNICDELINKFSHK